MTHDNTIIFNFLTIYIYLYIVHYEAMTMKL
jgi:hypothetical protein